MSAGAVAVAAGIPAGVRVGVIASRLDADRGKAPARLNASISLFLESLNGRPGAGAGAAVGNFVGVRLLHARRDRHKSCWQSAMRTSNRIVHECGPGAGAAPGVIKHRATHTGLRRLRAYHSTVVCRLNDTRAGLLTQTAPSATTWCGRRPLGLALTRRQPRHFVRQLRPLLGQSHEILASF
jgi:hypothetical protein